MKAKGGRKWSLYFNDFRTRLSYILSFPCIYPSIYTDVTPEESRQKVTGLREKKKRKREKERANKMGGI